jgi:hypothetical protein
MPRKTIQIDLGNANWRYVTGIYDTQDLGCSIYLNEKITEDRLSECQAIFPKMTFRIVELKS